MRNFDLEEFKRKGVARTVGGIEVKFVAHLPEAKQEDERLVVLRDGNVRLYHSNGMYFTRGETSNFDLETSPPVELKTPLQMSIEHWENIVLGKASSRGRHTCALCQVFHPSCVPGKSSCSGCPVRERTGKDFCEGTPFDKFGSVSVRRQDEYGGFADSPAAREAAFEELAFLRSL